MTDLDDFIYGLQDSVEAEKAAASDLSGLSEDELICIVFADDVEKTALEYQSSPKSDMKAWPEAAMGHESAGRKATAEEMRQQEKTVMPDIAHVRPRESGDRAVDKSASKVEKLFSRNAIKKIIEFPGPRVSRALDLAKTHGRAEGGAAGLAVGGAVGAGAMHAHHKLKDHGKTAMADCPSAKEPVKSKAQNKTALFEDVASPTLRTLGGAGAGALAGASGHYAAGGSNLKVRAALTAAGALGGGFIGYRSTPRKK